MSFRVDGIPVDNKEQADVLADRMFARFSQTKTINIVEVYDDGCRTLVDSRVATKDNTNVDNDTLGLFDDVRFAHSSILDK